MGDGEQLGNYIKETGPINPAEAVGGLIEKPDRPKLSELQKSGLDNLIAKVDTETKENIGALQADYGGMKELAGSLDPASESAAKFAADFWRQHGSEVNGSNVARRMDGTDQLT